MKNGLMIGACAVVVSMAALSLSAGSAKGQGMIEVQEIVEACRADYYKFCPGVIPGGGRIIDCLSAYQRQLSTPCHEALAIAIAIRSCRFDYNRFCRDVEPGGARVLHCLRARERDLSPSCRDAIFDGAARSDWRGYDLQRSDGDLRTHDPEYDRARRAERRTDPDYRPTPDYERAPK